MEVNGTPVQACVSGSIPLLVYINSDIDKALRRAMEHRGTVRVTLEVE